MNLITTGSPVTTMSSREIAELVESRHADVCRTIERLIEKSVIGGCAPTAYTHEQNGQQYTEYHLNKRDSYIVVAQLSPEFTARLVDRWQELEDENKVALPDFNDPVASARAWADQVEQRQRIAIERDHAIATKAQIGSKREATAMARVAVANKEVARLKDQLGFSVRQATILQVEEATGQDFDFLPLRRWCQANEVVAESVPDKRYPKGVKAWPAAAWLARLGTGQFPAARGRSQSRACRARVSRSQRTGRVVFAVAWWFQVGATACQAGRWRFFDVGVGQMVPGGLQSDCGRFQSSCLLPLRCARASFRSAKWRTTPGKVWMYPDAMRLSWPPACFCAASNARSSWSAS